MTPAELATLLTPARLQAVLEPLLRRVTQLLVDAAVAEAPARSGALRRSITYAVDAGALQATIWPTADYAVFVHEGTRPHVITARHTQANGRPGFLAFPGRNGMMVFTRSVQHPGTAPNPFLDRALASQLPAIDALLGQAGDAIWGGVAR